MNNIFFLVQNIKVCQAFKIPIRLDVLQMLERLKSTLKNRLDIDVIIKSVQGCFSIDSGIRSVVSSIKRQGQV